VADLSISHDWQDETPEAKARWFQALSVTERLGVFFNLMDVYLGSQPKGGGVTGCYPRISATKPSCVK
jgi:hypothetical protein